MEPQDLAREIAELVSDKKGEDIVVLDVRPVSYFADFFVISTAGSARQLKAMLDDVVKSLKAQGQKPFGVEGEPESGWILMDFGSVVVHLFDAGTRDYYNLEELWSEAKVVAHIQ